MIAHFIKLVNDQRFNAVDVSAAGVGVMTMAQWLPWVSAGLSAVWVALRIYVLVRDEIINHKVNKNGD